MTDERWNKANTLLNPHRLWLGFNGGGTASVGAKNHLRRMLADRTGHPDAELIRDFFNTMREEGERIDCADVRAATRVLNAIPKN